MSIVKAVRAVIYGRIIQMSDDDIDMIRSRNGRIYSG